MRENLSRFVSGESILSGVFPLLTSLKLSQVPMVIPLHLQIKHLRVPRRCGGDQPRVQQLQYPLADPRELRLDLPPVIADRRHVVVVAAALLLLLDRRYDAPRGAPRADHVLVSDGEEVTLLDGELVAVDGGGDFLHELHHLLVALGLLGELGHVHELLTRGNHFR